MPALVPIREAREEERFAQQFTLMVRDRKGGQLDTWLEAVAQSPLRDLYPFVKGIRLDIEAVEVGLILPWSNGPVEEKINKLKSIKRSMYEALR
jgi:transposase